MRIGTAKARRVSAKVVPSDPGVEVIIEIQLIDEVRQLREVCNGLHLRCAAPRNLEKHKKKQKQ